MCCISAHLAITRLDDLNDFFLLVCFLDGEQHFLDGEQHFGKRFLVGPLCTEEYFCLVLSLSLHLKSECCQIKCVFQLIDWLFPHMWLKSLLKPSSGEKPWTGATTLIDLNGGDSKQLVLCFCSTSIPLPVGLEPDTSVWAFRDLIHASNVVGLCCALPEVTVKNRGF